MEKWRALSDEEQEKVIGRKKFNDIELDDDEKPLTAHNVVSKAHDAEGNELKIMRANMPFRIHPKMNMVLFLLATHVNLVRHVKCLKICS